MRRGRVIRRAIAWRDRAERAQDHAGWRGGVHLAVVRCRPGRARRVEKTGAAQAVLPLLSATALFLAALAAEDVEQRLVSVKPISALYPLALRLLMNAQNRSTPLRKAIFVIAGLLLAPAASAAPFAVPSAPEAVSPVENVQYGYGGGYGRPHGYRGGGYGRGFGGYGPRPRFYGRGGYGGRHFGGPGRGFRGGYGRQFR
ncbi:hypothetical protein MetexDRAFT_5559 [Methylorubrum extorquens DSM 13060]|uniref:Uncharacterized protein n=1 Tax=Methylorubrum extorquens DSM 13060 TaxID=882800 RepID=H1KSE6_METEX|nr:hypothetical protein MetexDRAFT_5559 [Methylorubrum extorquens DSM 13060]